MSLTPYNAVFMGTPQFAATILEKILASPLVSIKAVYTQPDRPAGRGKTLKAPEVKELALAHGLPVLQPLNFKNQEDRDTLAAFKPDFLFVAAYGLILPQAVLDIPSILPINVHASLLPKYRGAAPIQRSIMAGDTVTGVTIMEMQAGLDSGPILMQQAVGIDIQDTSARMHDELAIAGAELLLATLERMRTGRVLSMPQDPAKVTLAPKLAKEDGRVNLGQTVEQIHAHIRGVTPWPGARLTLQREGLEPLAVQVEPGPYPFTSLNLETFDPALSPGSIAGVKDNALIVRCGDGFYAFTALQPAGKKAMNGHAFFNGYLAPCPGAAFTLPE